ncbi:MULTISPECIES: hypothetical protein [unclassified Francisella]|uniref:hypothetical protein n=1 Tax=unclassified Francisella TaxID=2610885 RepID=UPI002E3016C4|nr:MULTISPECIES: hypothetical protein [unclassified Francisella]MED7819835.1 hypothetical protein [Francisella sp. 19S2-4]MED7830650.1 hypothetical protein [Francisella sp. 19S2-10]
MKKNLNNFSKWLHPIFAANSMLFLLTIIDKEKLVASSTLLIFCVYCYSISLILNSVWSFIYYISDSNNDINKSLRSNRISKGLDNLSFWSFIFATISFVAYIVLRTTNN